MVGIPQFRLTARPIPQTSKEKEFDEWVTKIAKESGGDTTKLRPEDLAKLNKHDGRVRGLRTQETLEMTPRRFRAFPFPGETGLYPTANSVAVRIAVHGGPIGKAAALEGERNQCQALVAL